MTYGVTPTGFSRPTIAQIKSDRVSRYRELFGDQVNTESNSPLGVIIDVESIKENEVWDAMEDEYNSQYAQLSEGVSLDNAAQNTGLVRLGAAKSTVTGRIFADIATTVPIGFRASVTGDTTAVFETVEEGTVTTGIDEVQTVTFSGTPTSGSFKLVHNTNQTVAIDWDDTATEVQTALNNLASLSAVTVTGTYAAGFVVTFTGADGDQNQPLLTTADNSLDDGGAVTITVTETTKGYAPFVDLSMTSVNTGPVVANAGSLTVIDTPTAGVNGVTNLSNAVLGRNQETDAEFKLRRIENLQTTQNGTDAGIRSKILNVTNVLAARVTSNRQSTTVGGVPPHNIQAVVLGGTDADVANAIIEAQPCGIDTFGTTTVPTIDSQGETIDISFSRPTEVDIYFVIDITDNTDASEGPVFPADGAQQIKDKILAYVANFSIGNDVVMNQFYTPINQVAGVIGADIYLGTAPAPATQDNIAISNTQIAAFADARITVNIL